MSGSVRSFFCSHLYIARYAAFAYSGGAAHPGVNLFAIPRIPVSDQDSGARFAALLREQNIPDEVKP